MTLEEIKIRIKEIEIGHFGDDEAQHADEDCLYHDFVEYVSTCESPELQEMAKEILKTETMEFARFCA